MFLKVTDKNDKPMFINANYIYYVIQGRGESNIIYDDNSILTIKEDLIEILQQIVRIKGVDDE